MWWNRGGSFFNPISVGFPFPISLRLESLISLSASGQLVRTLVRELPARSHILNWSGRDDRGRAFPAGCTCTGCLRERNFGMDAFCESGSWCEISNLFEVALASDSRAGESAPSSPSPHWVAGNDDRDHGAPPILLIDLELRHPFLSLSQELIHHSGQEAIDGSHRIDYLSPWLTRATQLLGIDLTIQGLRKLVLWKPPVRDASLAPARSLRMATTPLISVHFESLRETSMRDLLPVEHRSAGCSLAESEKAIIQARSAATHRIEGLWLSATPSQSVRPAPPRQGSPSEVVARH